MKHFARLLLEGEVFPRLADCKIRRYLEFVGWLKLTLAAQLVGVEAIDHYAHLGDAQDPRSRIRN